MEANQGCVFRVDWTAASLTGRSEAVLSRYLILWFNALYQRKLGRQMSGIKNVGGHNWTFNATETQTRDQARTKTMVSNSILLLVRACTGFTFQNKYSHCERNESLTSESFSSPE